MWTRFIYNDNGSLTEFTREVNDYNVGSAAIPDYNNMQDYFYIGSVGPGCVFGL